MKRETPNERLEGEIERHRKRLHEGELRILDFYRDGFAVPDKYPELEEPPHLTLMREGLEYIEFAATDLTGEWTVFDSTESQVELLVYGVGMEFLLNGIHLKIAEDDFLDYVEKHLDQEEQTPGRSPSFGYSKGVVVSDLSEKLPEEQSERLELALDWVQDHRNNEVHLAYHRHRANYLERLIMEIAYKLFEHYSEIDIPEIQSLKSRVEGAKRLDQHSLSSDIEFDPDNILAG